MRAHRAAAAAAAGIALAVAGLAAAQPPGPAGPPGASLRPPEPITLAWALHLAWTRNPRVLEAERNLQAAGYESTGAYGGFLPSVTVTAVDNGNAPSAVQGSWAFWKGGTTLAQIDFTEAREAGARAGVTRTRLTVGGEALVAFHDLVQAQDQLAQWGRYLAALERLHATIQNRAAAGVAPRADVEAAVSRRRQAEVGREAAALLLVASRTELGRILEAAPEAAVPEGDLAPEIIALGTQPLAAQVDTHPDVRIAAAQVDEQVATADQALSQMSPEFAIQYRHYYANEQFANDPAADQALLVATYPVGNSFSALKRFEAERAKVGAAQARQEAVRRDVEAALRLTREQLASSDKQYRLQQLAVGSSQALVESFLRQYQVGRRSWVEVLNAQRELHELELGLIAARRAFLLAGHQLALQTSAWELLMKLPRKAPPPRKP